MAPFFLCFVLLSTVIFITFFIQMASISLLTDRHGFPRNWPILGMLPGVLANYSNLLDWIASVANRTGLCTFRVKGPVFSNLDLLLTIDPANVQYTSSIRYSNFLRGPKSKELFDLFGNGQFNAELTERSHHRKIQQVFFNHKRLGEYCYREVILNKVEKGLGPILDHVAKGTAPDGDVVNLQDLFQRYTYDLTSKLVSGFDPESLSLNWPEVPFSQAMNNAMQAIFMRHFLPERIWKFQRLLGVGKEKALQKAKKVLYDIVRPRVTSKHEQYLKDYQSCSNQHQLENQDIQDILTTYMLEDEHYRSGGVGSEVLKDTILSLLLAGTDTTSTGMVWFFWLLSKHPTIKTKIKQELTNVLPEDQRGKWHIFTQDELSKLVYLHATLYETLRLYPPVPFQTRVPLVHDVLPSGHQTNPGSTLIIVPLYVMARSKQVWGEDCAEFKPERWIMADGSGIKHEPSHKFFTFNSGPNLCLGKELAFIEMKAAIAVMLHNYNIDIIKEQKVEPLHSVILQTKYGLRAKVSKRVHAFS